MVTRFTPGKDSMHRNHPSPPRVTLTNAADVRDFLLASHLLKSDLDVRILPDIPYPERSLAQNIPTKSRETFFRG